MRSLLLTTVFLSSLALFCALPGLAQSQPAPVPPTELSAGLGHCSALVTVTGADAKPVYNAKVSTQIRYGFLGAKKLDLEAYTSAAGQVKFTGLPEVLKKPMFLNISKDERTDSVEFNPEQHCRATFDVHLK